jgi:DNA-binding PadR family transcriptional regulator
MVAKDLHSGLIRLHIIHHACEEPIFGLNIMEELTRHGYKLSAGTLYPMLHGMEKAGYLKSETQYSDGRKRRVYRATKEGHKALRLSKVKVKELFEELFEEKTHDHKA